MKCHQNVNGLLEKKDSDNTKKKKQVENLSHFWIVIFRGLSFYDVDCKQTEYFGLKQLSEACK